MTPDEERDYNRLMAMVSQSAHDDRARLDERRQRIEHARRHPYDRLLVVRQHFWAECLNSAPIRSRNSEWKHGETFGLPEGTVVGVIRDKDDAHGLLMQVVASMDMGAVAPIGGLFRVKLDCLRQLRPSGVLGLPAICVDTVKRLMP